MKLFVQMALLAVMSGCAWKSVDGTQKSAADLRRDKYECELESKRTGVGFGSCMDSKGWDIGFK